MREPRPLGKLDPPNGNGLPGSPVGEHEGVGHWCQRALSDAQLLAVIWSGGQAPEAEDLESAQQMLLEVGGIRSLPLLDPATLQRRRLSDRQGAALLASLELADRLAQTIVPLRTAFARPRTVVGYLWQRYGAFGQELHGAAWLDGRKRLIAERILRRGALDPHSQDPRILLDEAFLRGASGILLFHLVPASGAEPSPEALSLSGRMLERCEEEGFDFVDHLLIRDPGSWVSLREIW